jgi:hypothetical protein
LVIEAPGIAALAAMQKSGNGPTAMGWRAAK